MKVIWGKINDRKKSEDSGLAKAKVTPEELHPSWRTVDARGSLSPSLPPSLPPSPFLHPKARKELARSPALTNLDSRRQRRRRRRHKKGAAAIFSSFIPAIR